MGVVWILLSKKIMLEREIVLEGSDYPTHGPATPILIRAIVDTFLVTDRVMYVDSCQDPFLGHSICVAVCIMCA